jgi:uncharacterized Fe-S center protein
MEKAKVYFIDMRATGRNMLDKMEAMLKAAGFFDIEYKDKFVAIKMHFGEPGNLSYIRPNYAASVVELVRSAGGKPFLTDCNTLYKGRRSNAVDHLLAASENGFNRLSASCDVIVADGLRGTEFREVEIGKKHVKRAKIGSAIADSDIVISLSHFKGHEMTGFGGALKNLGMGSGSVGGKLEMHSDSKPEIKREACIGCGACVRNCAQEAIVLDSDKKAVIDYAKCVGCGQCIAMCRYGAAAPNWNAASAQEKIAEYALAVVKDKPNFHVGFVMNVSPECDCWNRNDAAIVPDIGILASADPVALDAACYDLVNAAPVNKGSAAEGSAEKDVFQAVHPGIDGRLGLAYAESIGLGCRDYELIRL